ncbi:unnamed protein product [Rhizoctonia solani]|uniref:Small ribosomal subunit protein uS4 N-terminal domain-containing protein n=1 Tax=Rhizoctonia solani TaxID=456999 RepID=A0A8H3E8G9_9AGAM|nr:unnamed protein product [Rhizoctonia solani]
MPRAPRNHSKTYKVPRRPFESARLDAELKLAGEYGLRNKREIWRISLVLSKIRRAARELLKLEAKDPKRLFEGNALIRRLVRIGVLDEDRMRLDYVLALKIEDFLERRLQTQVFKSGLAKSIHHAPITLSSRKPNASIHQHSKGQHKATIRPRSGPRRSQGVVASQARLGYRPDLRRAALQRVTALIRAQQEKKAAPERKVRGKKAKAAAESA